MVASNASNSGGLPEASAEAPASPPQPPTSAGQSLGASSSKQTRSSWHEADAQENSEKHDASHAKPKRTHSQNAATRGDAHAQPPRETAADKLPSTLLVRHRMGFTVVKLSKHQQKTYGRDKLEDFVLYKEQKYNAVNALSRFMLVYSFFLVVTIFCVAFCMCSPNWHLVRYRNYNVAMGIFTACTDRVFAECTNRASAHRERYVLDTETGQEVCAVRGSFLRNYIGAMWSLAIVQLLGLALLLILAGWISFRPTRSRALLTSVLIALLCMCCNIVNCVLFSVYVRCDRKTCVAHHLSSMYCDIRYMWAYKVYIATAALHAVVFLVGLSMYSFIQRIYTNAAVQLHRERTLRARQDFLNDYIRNLVETMTHEPQTARSVQNNSLTPPSAATAAAASAGHPATVKRSHDEANHESRRRASAPVAVRPEIEKGPDDIPTMHLHVEFKRDPYETSVMEEEGTVIGRAGGGLVMTRGGTGSPSTHAVHSAPASTMPSRANSVLVKAERRKFVARQSKERDTALQGASANVNSTAPTTKHNNTNNDKSNAQDNDDAKQKKRDNFFQYIRRHQGQLLSLFGHRDGDSYLTAEELGIRIDGAQDWLYDDRSDMYYSYELNMFWDPITREYYNCALQIWQEAPHEVVEIRDAGALAQELPFLNDFE